MDAGGLSRVLLNNRGQKNFHHSNDVHQLSWVFTSSRNHSLQKHSLILFAILLFLGLASLASAQIESAPPAIHVRGSVVTHEGEPVADATVEIRDLQGNELRKSSTDAGGSFEILAAMVPGEYILLAANRTELQDRRITLADSDLSVRIAFPSTSEDVGAKPHEGTVSVEQLGIPAKARAHLSVAHKEFRRMDLNGAMKEIDAALSIDPDWAQAFSMRALLRLAARDPAGAVEDAMRAIVLDGSDAQAYIALGTAYNSLREFTKAEAAIRQALNLNPDSWQAQIEMAKSFYGRGALVLALRQLDAIRKDFPDVHLVRGNVLMRLDRRHEAMDEFKAFLKQAAGDSRKEQIEQLVSSQLR
jgi:tetratricopeptide (TPR) repeat protein